jgi:dihydrofolate reductase
MKVILVMAITLDGKIARSSDHPVNWTGQEDKNKFVRITKKAGVVIMGSKTYDAIGKTLPGRRNIVMTRNKNRISTDDNLIFSDKTPETIVKELHDEGFKEAAVIGGSIINSEFAARDLIDELYLTVVPCLFGTGLSLFNCELHTRLRLLEIERMNTDYLLLRYAVRKKAG